MPEKFEQVPLDSKPDTDKSRYIKYGALVFAAGFAMGALGGVVAATRGENPSKEEIIALHLLNSAKGWSDHAEIDIDNLHKGSGENAGNFLGILKVNLPGKDGDCKREYDILVSEDISTVTIDYKTGGKIIDRSGRSGARDESANALDPVFIESFIGDITAGCLQEKYWEPATKTAQTPTTQSTAPITAWA